MTLDVITNAVLVHRGDEGVLRRGVLRWIFAEERIDMLFADQALMGKDKCVSPGGLCGECGLYPGFLRGNRQLLFLCGVAVGWSELIDPG
jgi:hypothetical protein